MNPLEKVPLGKTDVRVTRLGMGGAALAGLYRDSAEETATATVHRALELGVNFIDTAPLYGHGKSELRLGRALAGRARDRFVLASKVGRLLVPAGAKPVESIWFENPAPFEPVFDFSYDGVMRSFEESLTRLQMDRIDVIHIHDPDDHYEQALQGAYPALCRLREQGLIRALSVGMNGAEMLVRFARDAEFDCFLLAGRYTLIDLSGLNELLPLCLEKGISIILGAPYNSGILATGARPGAKFNYADAPPELMEKVRRMEAVCARHGVPLKAAALQFPLGHPAVATVIPGARSPEEVEENFRMMSHPIPPACWQELRSEGLIPPEAPLPAASG
jgi:D-threo-aldose 1-dehydrogenase